MQTYLNKIKTTTTFIQNKINNFKPQYGIVLGTGLGGLVNKITIENSIDYTTIPNFAVSTVETHKGRLIWTIRRQKGSGHARSFSLLRRLFG